MKNPTLRYRSPTVDGPPPIGCILMGDGPRVRRGYRVVATKAAKSTPPALGVTTWKVAVESMPAERARLEIRDGAPHWSIQWDRRGKADTRDARIARERLREIAADPSSLVSGDELDERMEEWSAE